MAADGNQAQKETNNSFGLPRATFKPIEPTGSSNWLKITAIIVVIVLIIGAGVVYWLFKRSSSSYNDFMAKMLKKQVEQEQSTNESLQGDLENASDDLMGNIDKQAGDFIEDLRNKDQSLLEEPSKGFVQEIQAPQGQYYVIIASYIDRDLGMDYGKKLLKRHPYITLISPAKGKHFYRLAIDQGATFAAASEKVAALKADYGDQLWVLKY
jgi:Sec-independent protein translocase protein TatA